MKPKETQEKISKNGIRKATLDDAFAIAKINYDARKHNYKNIIDNDFLESIDFEKKIQNMQEKLEKGKSIFYIKELDDKIVGFVDGGVPRDEVPYEAEIYAIYVNPSTQGKGVGKELMNVIMNDEFFKNKKSLYLRTLKDNPQSRGFYEKLGGKVFAEKEHEFAGKKYSMVGYYRQK